MENKILEQIKKSETAMLDTLAQIVNIDSGYDALEGIDEVAHIIGDFLTPVCSKLALLSRIHEIIPKCRSASKIAFSLSGGHWGTWASLDFGLL